VALFAIVLAGIGVGVMRFGAVETAAGIAVFAAAILAACVAVLLAGAGAAVIWRTGRKGVGHVVVALGLSVALLAWPGWLATQAVMLPVINDISTDVNDPPQFPTSERALAARAGIDHGSAMAGALQQQDAYPDIYPIVIDLDAAEVFALVVRAVDALGWRIVEREPPTEALSSHQARAEPRRGAPAATQAGAAPARPGRIYAIDRTLIMGFPDDIAIRVRPLDGQTRIDLRSASRYGRHDFGVNANRIRRFGAELQRQLDAR